MQRDIRRSRRKSHVCGSCQNLRPVPRVHRQDKIGQGQACAIEFRPSLGLNVERGSHKRLRRRRRQRPVKNRGICRIQHAIGLDHGLRPKLDRAPRKLHSAAMRRCNEFYIEALVLLRNSPCEAVSISALLRSGERSINAGQGQRFGLGQHPDKQKCGPLRFRGSLPPPRSIAARPSLEQSRFAAASTDRGSETD